jgi:cytohesin
MLLDTGLVDLPRYNCGDLLSDAAVTGCEPLVRVLLTSGLVDANCEDAVGDGFTALHHAAEEGQTSVVRMLLAAGADVNVKSVDGTPLMLAADRGHDAVVQLLLATNQVDINAMDEHGRTALAHAVEGGPKAVANLLRAHGAQDDEGNT